MLFLNRVAVSRVESFRPPFDRVGQVHCCTHVLYHIHRLLDAFVAERSRCRSHIGFDAYRQRGSVPIRLPVQPLGPKAPEVIFARELGIVRTPIVPFGLFDSMGILFKHSPLPLLLTFPLAVDTATVATGLLVFVCGNVFFLSTIWTR